jgi:hypothetical protein
MSGADPGFQVRGYALKIIAPSEGRHKSNKYLPSLKAIKKIKQNPKYVI